MTYVLYHAGCMDGFGAAWALHLVLGEGAQYIPVSYGKPLPEMEDGSDVLIVDFSYGLEELRRLRERMRLVTVVDHHATMQQVLEQFATENQPGKVIFTTRHSGAALTWGEFLPTRELPDLIRYIEDRDLWTWALPESREVSAALASYPRDFALWDELADDLPRLKAEGRVALRLIDQAAQQQAKSALLQEFAGYQVPVVNATGHYDETAEHMGRLFPAAPFVAIYRDRGDTRRWTLRSRPGFDCSAVAQRFGGGGHPTASGFVQTIEPNRSVSVLRR